MVGQAEGANPGIAPGTDGNGSGVPDNSVIRNITNLANAVASDVAGTFAVINAPPGTPVQTRNVSVGGPVSLGGFSIGLIPLLLIIAAGFFIFREA